MPFNDYNSIIYNAANRKVSYDSIVVNNTIWLNHNTNLWCGKYSYTYSSERKGYFNKQIDFEKFMDDLQPNNIAQKYYMKNFIYNHAKETSGKIKYSKGTIYIGGDPKDDENISDIIIHGKLDIQSVVRSICRQEIEYALWNYTSKLIENNSSNDIVENLKPQNIDNFRLKWFYNKRFPIKGITLNGFPLGTDDTEFKEIKNEINLKKKIFL